MSNRPRTPEEAIKQLDAAREKYGRNPETREGRDAIRSAEANLLWSGVNGMKEILVKVGKGEL